MGIDPNGDDTGILVGAVLVSGEEFGFANMAFADNDDLVDGELVVVELAFVHYNKSLKLF